MSDFTGSWRENCLYSITSRREKLDSLHDASDMIQVISFDVCLEKYLEHFNFSTPVGEFVLANRVYLDCHVFVNHKCTMIHIISLEMVDFHVILGMDALCVYYALIDFRTQVVKFQSPSEPVLEWESNSVVSKGRFMSYLKAIKLVSNGFPYHLV